MTSADLDKMRKFQTCTEQRLTPAVIHSRVTVSQCVCGVQQSEESGRRSKWNLAEELQSVERL